MTMNVITNTMMLEMFEKAYDSLELARHFQQMADQNEKENMQVAKEYMAIADSNKSALMAYKDTFKILDIYDDWMAYKGLKTCTLPELIEEILGL